MFFVKDRIPGGLRSRVVYKFVCERCRTCYVGETVRHFCKRVKQHLSGIGLLAFAHICKILNIVAPCGQQIVSCF